MLQQEILHKLQEKFPEADVEVQGDFSREAHVHVLVLVVSKHFEGMSLVRQHQEIYQALDEFLTSGKVHALKIKTSSTPLHRTPDFPHTC